MRCQWLRLWNERKEVPNGRMASYSPLGGPPVLVTHDIYVRNTVNLLESSADRRPAMLVNQCEKLIE